MTNRTVASNRCFPGRSAGDDGVLDLSGAGAVERAGRHARLRRLRRRRHDPHAEADDDVPVHAGQRGPAGALSRTHRRVRRGARRGRARAASSGAWSRRRPGIPRGALSGTYSGVGAQASAGAGVGANVLVGGTGRAFSLQPVSIEGQTGLNIAGGVTTVTLLPPPPSADQVNAPIAVR